MCLELGISNKYCILAGALSYCFCNWVLLSVNRHPYFITPLIFMPLVILGIERVIAEKKSLTCLSCRL